MDICKDAIKEGNLNNSRVARAKTRRNVRLSKKTSWRNYRIRKIKGKESSNYIHHLSVNDRDVTSHRDIANALTDKCSHNLSSAFSTDAFTSARCKTDKHNINFENAENAWVYNRPFSLEELQDALRSAHDTSVGPDEIHYQLLKHLPDASLLLLLNSFNTIWICVEFPSDWRKAIIIPIPKPG